MANEEWRTVAVADDLYEVSSLGNVRRIGKTVILKQEISNAGYARVCLSVSGKSKKHSVHRLVATAFVDNIAGKPCVNHIDFNRQNNSAVNLEWTDYKENTAHSVTAGRIFNPKHSHCKKGHALTTDNVFIAANGNRKCLTCKRDYGRRQYHLYKAKELANHGK